MGLDSMIFATTHEIPKATDVQRHSDGTFPDVEVMRWRKFYDLHDYMYKLYVRKGGKLESYKFNCVGLKLTPLELVKLVGSIQNGKLKKSDFYDWSHTQSKWREDIRNMWDIIEEAQKGTTAFYYWSWW